MTEVRPTATGRAKLLGPYGWFGRVEESARETSFTPEAPPPLSIPPRTDRSAAIALPVSLALHALLALALVIWRADASFGAAGNDLGTGIQVSLVAGFAAGGPRAGTTATQAPPAEAEQAPEIPQVLHREGGEPDAEAAPAPAERREAARPPGEAALAEGEGGTAAGAFDGSQGADAARGGDPLALSDLAAQIARCLPPGLRPALPFARLTLAIGPDGRLANAPEVASGLPTLAAAERKAADRIVQAALLCGPYDHPGLAGRTVSIPADFSAAPDTRMAARVSGSRRP